MVTVRGAITVEENSVDEILKATREMLEEILAVNCLEDEHLIGIIFTATKDLDAAYPAVAARAIGITEASLLCMQEMYVVGSLKKCIRVLINVEKEGMSQRDVTHVYLRGAKVLRPDLLKGAEE